MPVVVAENDPIIRAAQVILDPDTPADRRAAISDYFSVDIPDFGAWIGEIRQKYPAACPADVRMVDDAAELHAALPGADALIVESLKIGPDELAQGGGLKIVQKFGIDVRNIDAAACAGRTREMATLLATVLFIPNVSMVVPTN